VTFYYYVTAENTNALESAASNTVSTKGETMQRFAGSFEEDESIPTEFSLAQNYPNPFNPETEISFALPEPSVVRLSVVDVLGRVIAVLEDRPLPAGYRTVRWNGRDSRGEAVGSGVYIYRITATGESGATFTRAMKMIVTK
jgi:hypothetical protein